MDTKLNVWADMELCGATASDTGVTLVRADTVNITSGRDVSSIPKAFAAPPFRERH